MTPPPLLAIGWTSDVAARLEPLLADTLSPGRIVRVDRGEVDVVVSSDRTVRATMTTAAKDCVAGDWVGLDLDAARVEAIAPRATAFVRRSARGARSAQTLAANMDVVLVCQ